jgi:hypothetical protein
MSYKGEMDLQLHAVVTPFIPEEDKASFRQEMKRFPESSWTRKSR